MKSIFHSEYSKFFIAALLLNILTAWFSLGYNQADEHFQILEFASFKLGNSPMGDLPWEYIDKIRPGLQPFITYCTIGTLNFIGIVNPFTIAFLFRLVMGFLTWQIVSKLVLLLLPDFITAKGKKIFILLSLFLWFIPYMSVRFSSEMTSALCFMWVIYLLLRPYEKPKQKNISFFFIGVLMALSFFFRFQIAFAIMGLGAWLLFVKRISVGNWVSMILSALCVSAMCVCIDRWLYGTWECTPYNYYYFNIVKHIAAGFGTSPWWDYFSMFFMMIVPPLSLALMCFFCIGIFKRPLHIFSFVFIPFLLGHMMVAHKEMRFLLPLWFAFIYLTAIGVDYCMVKYKDRKIYTFGFKTLVAVNIVILLYRTFTPAQEAVPCFKYAYDHYKQKPTTILCLHDPLFSLYGLNIGFYRPATVTQLVFKDEDTLARYLAANKQDSVIVFQQKCNISPKLTDNYVGKRVYSTFPDWFLKCSDFGKWQERAHLASIYILYKK